MMQKSRELFGRWSDGGRGAHESERDYKNSFLSSLFFFFREVMTGSRDVHIPALFSNFPGTFPIHTSTFNLIRNRKEKAKMGCSVHVKNVIPT